MVSTPTDNDDGTYTAELTGTSAGTASIGVTIGGTALALTPAPVELVAGKPDAGKSTFETDPKSIDADGSTESTLTFTAKDTYGNAVTGATDKVSFSVKDSNGGTPADGTVTVSSVTESSTPGIYTATLKGTLAGTYIVLPQFGGTTVGGLNDTVTLTPGEPNQVKSSITVGKTIYTSGDDMTVTLKDKGGNPVKRSAAPLK
ncbi:Ig-like domain-containing protein [Enterobacter asburiae]|uniref:Ig-like domain-containing protein n=1 Tax=Enterobacter asburiae TaxID=61645 RepID=UPI0021CB08F6|nr:Ig-like domain-containing protein [Enterobacter asburiae]